MVFSWTVDIIQASIPVNESGSLQIPYPSYTTSCVDIFVISLGCYTLPHCEIWQTGSVSLKIAGLWDKPAVEFLGVKLSRFWFYKMWASYYRTQSYGMWQCDTSEEIPLSHCLWTPVLFQQPASCLLKLRVCMWDRQWWHWWVCYEWLSRAPCSTRTCPSSAPTF